MVFKDAVVAMIEQHKKKMEQDTFEANKNAASLAEQWKNFIKLNEDIAQLGMVFRRDAEVALEELGFAPSVDEL